MALAVALNEMYSVERSLGLLLLVSSVSTFFLGVTDFNTFSILGVDFLFIAGMFISFILFSLLVLVVGAVAGIKLAMVKLNLKLAKIDDRGVHEL